MRGNPQFVAEHAVGQVGHLVGDDDGSAGRATRTISRKRSLGIVEVVEGADAEDGVELLARERQLLGLALGQPDRSAGRPAAAGLELRARDVHAHDAPVGRQPVEIDAVADRHVEQVQARPAREVPEHLVAGTALAAVAEPREPLPEPELGPERAVVELLGDLVVVGRLVLDDQDVVVDRQSQARTLGRPGRG